MSFILKYIYLECDKKGSKIVFSCFQDYIKKSFKMVITNSVLKNFKIAFLNEFSNYRLKISSNTCSNICERFNTFKKI